MRDHSLREWSEEIDLGTIKSMSTMPYFGNVAYNRDYFNIIN